MAGEERQAAPLRRWVQAFLDLVFPPRCGGCGRLGDWLCDRCRGQLSWLAPPVCPQCGYPVPRPGRCPRCAPAAVTGFHVRSAVFFDGPARHALHSFKYAGRRALGEPLAEILVELWAREAPPVQVVTPVPLHPSRVRKRGYNQSDLLARSLARRLGLPLEVHLLQRVRATRPQVGLSVAERWQNVAGAFTCRDGAAAGRGVLLVDDVCTTGATLQAAAAALRQGGAAEVWAFTVARSRREAPTASTP